MQSDTAMVQILLEFSYLCSAIVCLWVTVHVWLSQPTLVNMFVAYVKEESPTVTKNKMCFVAK